MTQVKVTSTLYMSLRHLMEASNQLHALTALCQGKEHPSSHFIRGWVGHKVGLNILELRNISHLHWELKSGPSSQEPFRNRHHLL